MSFPGDVPETAVLIFSQHDHALLPAGRGQEDLFRKNLQPPDTIRRLFAEGHSVGDPLEEGVVVGGVRLQPQAAPMGHLLGGLGQHQAAGRIGAIEAAARHVVEERLVVEAGIVAPQRELEAVLPLGRAVADALGATHLVDDRQDVLQEGGRPFPGRLDPNGNVHPERFGRDLERRFSRLLGCRKPWP